MVFICEGFIFATELKHTTKTELTVYGEFYKKFVMFIDPFLPTRNVTRSVTSNAMFYYIMGCLMTSCRYFGLPQTKQGPLFGEIYTRATKYHEEHEAGLQIHDKTNSKLIRLILKLDPGFKQQRAGMSIRHLQLSVLT